MIGKLRYKIESKRNSKNIFWRVLIGGKDFLWREAIRKAMHLRLLGAIKTHLMMHKIDNKKIPENKNEIRLFMVVKNEILRLPYIFKYYSKLGVERFFIIDNDSTDKTIPFLLSQKNTHVFRIKGSYKKSNFGNDWLLYILKRYGVGYWCVVVDADEILIYPHYEKISLKQLCTYLDFEKATALGALLLDMYSNKSIRLTKYKKGANPLLVCPYFDKDSHYKSIKTPFTSFYFDKCYYYISKYAKKVNEKMLGYMGGMRERVFNIKINLTKLPLFKFNSKLIIYHGQHVIDGINLSEIKGATFHFKYFNNFIQQASKEIKRKEHWRKASDYKKYAKKFMENPNLNLFYKSSVKFKDSRQLVKLKIMETSEEFEKYVKQQD